MKITILNYLQKCIIKYNLEMIYIEDKKKGITIMNNKKSPKTSKGGIYIAVCCFAVLAAAIGYAGRNNINSSKTKPEDISSTEIVSKNTTPSQDFDNSVLKSNQEDKIEITVNESDSVNVSKKTEVVVEEDKEDIMTSKKVETSDNTNKFIMPVEGTVVCAFSGDELIFNKYLSDWRTHNGIDISCEKDSAIYASADGIVSEILDNSMGKSVLIDHENGYVSVYSNLSEEIEVKAGESIKSGDLIGKVSDTNASDFTNEHHLHFEILYEDKYVDPGELLSQ